MLLNRLQAILNRNLDGSRTARELCSRLEGRVLCLEVVGTPITLYFKVMDARIEISPRHDGAAADASIAGTPISLLALAGAQAEQGLRSGSVRIEGDAEVAQGFRRLLEQTQPEFEEELSRVIGDVAAHRVAGLARGLLQWGQRTTGSLATNVAEYLQEEGRDLPTRLEVEEFVGGVDGLRDDAERLEARLAKLEAQSGGGTPTRGRSVRTPRR